MYEPDSVLIFDSKQYLWSIEIYFLLDFQKMKQKLIEILASHYLQLERYNHRPNFSSISRNLQEQNNKLAGNYKILGKHHDGHIMGKKLK